MNVSEKKSYDVDNQTIADALGSGSALYVIPQFQRKYAWTKKEIDDLLFDLFDEMDWSNEDLSKLPSHFLGSIVIASISGVDTVLDGQQRLASVSLLLSVIKKKLSEESSGKAGLVDQYLKKLSLKVRGEDQIRLKLQPEDAPIYEMLVRDPTKCRVKELNSSLLAKATQATSEKVDEYLVKAREAGATVEAALLSMLERVLSHTTLVKIVAPSEADAFRLFETLNDRGLALNAADLVKNKILARCREKKYIDEAVDIWSQIIEDVGEGEIVNFLRYYWIAFHGNVRQRELYKVFEAYLNRMNSNSALTLARDLKSSAQVYKQIIKPVQDKQIWKAGTNEVLERLSVYKARSCRPALLSCAKHRPGDMLKVAKACEVITVRYSIVSNLGSNDLERSYAQLARALKQKQKSIPELLKIHLETRSLSRGEFERNFSEVDITSVSEVWRQILIQLNDQLSTGETSVENAQKVHVEHIFPRNPSPEALRESQILNKEDGTRLSCLIGNLTLLSGELNRKASNHAFTVKKPAFASSEIALNRNISIKDRWGEKEITERSEFLAGLATKVWPWPIE